MSTLKIDLRKTGQSLVNQLRERVPRRTGRLANSIQYRIDEVADGYVISLIMEDYFKWLKERTRTPRLPSPRELAMARKPLPKMNTLGVVRMSELSPRSQGILRGVDVSRALEEIDPRTMGTQISKILTYDKL